MASKDVRNRYGGRRAGGRKGSYQWSQQNSWELPQATGAEEAAVPGLINSNDDLRQYWDGAQDDNAKTETQSREDFLARLPTPSRAPDPAFKEQYPAQHEENLRYLQGHDRTNAGTHELWNLPKHEEERQMSPTQPQPSYREWLQARGQQAMQRTMTGGGSNMSPTTSVASPTASPHTGQILSSLPPGQAALPPCPPLPMSAPAGPDPMMPWGHLQPPVRQPPLQMPPQPPMQPQMQQPPMQQPWCPSPGGLDMPFGPAGHMGGYQQPAPTLPPAALARVPALEEACGQQSPMMSMMSPCGMAPPMNGGDMMCGPLTPSTAAPSPVGPATSQLAIPPPNGERWSQEEVVAQLMPGILGMDKQQLAQQLRDAAECVYDD